MDRGHFKCLFWKALWGLSAVSLVGAWFTSINGPIFGFETLYWFWNALVLGVLAVPIKLDCHSCGVCSIGK